MELERKHIFLIAGSVLLATAIGIGLYMIFNKPSEDKPKDEKDKGGDNTPPDSKTPPPSNTGGNTTTNSSNASSIQNGQVVPIFDEENQLKNSVDQLKEATLYPKRQWQGGSDYANIRTSAEVNTESAWYDPFDNLLTTIGAGTPIGKVTSATTTVYNGFPYRWLKVKLNKPIGFWAIDVGYVRADTVTFVPYKYVKS